MDNDDIKIKIIDINDTIALVTEAKKKPLPLSAKDKKLIDDAKKKTEKEKREKGILYFTEDEYKKMPKQIRKLFKAGGISAHVRKTKEGLYQIRARSQGLDIQVTNKEFEKCKAEFLSKLSLNLQIDEEPKNKTAKNIMFNDYMESWIETVKKPEVKTVTYKDYVFVLNKNIKNSFENVKVTEVTRSSLQKVITNYYDEGKNYPAK